MPNLPYDYWAEKETMETCRICGEDVDFLDNICDRCLAQEEDHDYRIEFDEMEEWLEVEP